MKKQHKMTVAQFFQAVENFDEKAIYIVRYTQQFNKSVNLSFRRNLDLELLTEVVYILAQGKKLTPKYKQHKLLGYSVELWECHISPDWLLTWQQKNNELIIILVDTGTHSDLFG
ncbi:MAG: type II toxin-antitoxin system YafQ family toxin [Prevotellaceae bacterium]|jgi:mRNA interferase YafQ|nr:type II toxin-antitoxin system YafQ family toxin [Prevotellaceae bacterium]